MTAAPIRLTFDLTNLLERVRRAFSNHVGDLTLTLPFFSVDVNPQGVERAVARELVIRLKDRRVLVAEECCDDCIDRSLASIGDIRQQLVDKQVELRDLQDGPLFAILEFMRVGIVQFLTHEELLRRNYPAPDHSQLSRVPRAHDSRQAYFDALNVLRRHLLPCMRALDSIAGMDPGRVRASIDSGDAWDLRLYTPLPKAATPKRSRTKHQRGM